MSKVISRHVEFLPDGGACTTIEWEGGFKVSSYTMSLPDGDVLIQQKSGPRYAPGNAGYQRAMRTIDARVENGAITAAEGRRMEEDCITRLDREGW
jgi:hypothetical protein